MQYGPIASQRPLFFKAAPGTAAMISIVTEFEIDMEKYSLHSQKLGRTSDDAPPSARVPSREGETRQLVFVKLRSYNGRQEWQTGGGNPHVEVFANSEVSRSPAGLFLLFNIEYVAPKDMNCIKKKQEPR